MGLSISKVKDVRKVNHKQRWEECSWTICSRDRQDRKHTLGTKIEAIDRLKQPTLHCAAFPWCWLAGKHESCNSEQNSLTYSEFDQSKPAGQSGAPVRSWWNPQSVLTLRARGGFSGCPLGVIQSRTAPFRLFVSSAWVLEAPFWIWDRCTGKLNIELKKKIPCTRSAMCRIFSSDSELRRWFCRPGTMAHRASYTFCSHWSLKIWVDIYAYNIQTRLTFETILCRGPLPITHGMNGTPKMPPMMN